MRNTERLACGAWLCLCLAAPVHAVAPAESDLLDPPSLCLELPGQSSDVSSNPCPSPGNGQKDKVPDNPVPDAHDNSVDGNQIEKGVPDVEGESGASGGYKSVTLSDGTVVQIREKGANEAAVSRRIMWRQIM
ncbi:hypothetical protein NVV94_22815 [Pseudomonas sp. LS1212]|uniref:hypothetical protein n=1 Tax=Pseudomonas sp. LS1212 TaxID=2972478 RepID=UPI00215C13D5|nr:hypothetical protein [Pseudomonas sp. LS1212]UVJ43354.1 hypothetical protein NVV94_22815 [Pseudomonas sp. LS1212]